jgi:hypothetical protein
MQKKQVTIKAPAKTDSFKPKTLVKSAKLAHKARSKISNSISIGDNSALFTYLSKADTKATQGKRSSNNSVDRKVET